MNEYVKAQCNVSLDLWHTASDPLDADKKGILVVDIPEDQWMTIPLVDGWESQLPKSKIYPLGPKDREVVDQAFQPLHDQGKMSYTSRHTQTGFSVFVVWRTVHKPGREPERKGRAVVDLRPLNKVTLKDVYPNPTMSGIIPS